MRYLEWRGRGGMKGRDFRQNDPGETGGIQCQAVLHKVSTIRFQSGSGVVDSLCENGILTSKPGKTEEHNRR